MDIIKVLNCKFSDEIDRGLLKNYEYITADKQIRRFIHKEFSKEKAERLDDLLGILTSVVGDTYEEEGIRLGARSAAASFFEEDDL